MGRLVREKAVRRTGRGGRRVKEESAEQGKMRKKDGIWEGIGWRDGDEKG